MSTDVTVIRQNINYITRLETTSCGVCGVPFAMPEDLLTRARQDKDEWFWCPNGHKLHYSEDENSRLRRERDTLKLRRDSLAAALTHEQDQRRSAERSAAAFKGQATRMRKRIGKGVCPCCHRSFKQVTAHMERMHPGYADEPVTETS
jgi:hypothetical protein